MVRSDVGKVDRQCCQPERSGAEPVRVRVLAMWTSTMYPRCCGADAARLGSDTGGAAMMRLRPSRADDDHSMNALRASSQPLASW